MAEKGDRFYSYRNVWLAEARPKHTLNLPRLPCEGKKYNVRNADETDKVARPLHSTFLRLHFEPYWFNPYVKPSGARYKPRNLT